MRKSTYPLERRFSLRLLSLVLCDPAYGHRIISVIDPARIPFTHQREVYLAVKALWSGVSGAPSHSTIEQYLRIRHEDGALTRADVDAASTVARKAFSVDPLSRVEALTILRKVLLDASMGAALEKAMIAYRQKEIDDVRSLIDEPFSLVRKLDVGTSGRSMRERRKEYVAQIASGKQRIVRIPTGFLELDERLKGGLGRGALGCIMAARKAGKSMALVYIAQTAVLCGLTVVYITLELKEPEVEDRITAGLIDIPLDSLERGGPAVSRYVDSELDRVFSRGGDYIVKYFPPKTLTPTGLEACLHDIRREYETDIDVVVIDYADEMRSEDREVERSSYAKGDDIYGALKALGCSPEESSYGRGGFDCAVWTASQVQRDAMDKEVIGMGRIDKSIDKVSKVDLLLSLNQDDDEAESDLFRWYVAACRHAPGNRGALDELGPYEKAYSCGLLAREVGREESVKRWQRDRIKSRIRPLTRGIVAGLPTGWITDGLGSGSFPGA